MDNEFAEIRRELLYKAIEDNQNTIRFTDSKAGAVFVLCGVIFAFIGTLFKDIINFNKKLINIFPNNYYDVLFQTLLLMILFAGILCIYLSIRLSVKAISPKSGPLESITVDTQNKIPNFFYLYKINPSPSLFNLFKDKAGTFQLDTKFTDLVNQLEDTNNSNLENLLIVELQKVSFIRELKIQRVRQAIKLLLWGVDLLLIKLVIIFLITVYS